MPEATDARERRRQRAQEQKGSTGSGFSPKSLLVPLVIILLWGGVTAYNVSTYQDAEPCPGHWHSTMTLVVDGQRVTFTGNPKYTLEGGTMPVQTHMHNGGESLWHFEPTSPKCIPYRDALKRVDMEMSPGKLALSGDYHAERGWGGTYTDEGNSTLRAWVKPWQGEWESIGIAKLDAMQVPDGHEVLIVYGDEDEAGVAELQSNAQRNTQTPGASVGPAFPWGPVIGVSLMAILALFVWRTFSKASS